MRILVKKEEQAATEALGTEGCGGMGTGLRRAGSAARGFRWAFSFLFHEPLFIAKEQTKAGEPSGNLKMSSEHTASL